MCRVIIIMMGSYLANNVGGFCCLVPSVEEEDTFAHLGAENDARCSVIVRRASLLLHVLPAWVSMAKKMKSYQRFRTELQAEPWRSAFATRTYLLRRRHVCQLQR